ncbi:uncharacterized protein N7459_002751 [Penicillium hispanicum]|uniref:uncharacterized protein n=1 Tax=Penicillium hispanicum TaxID=1080232 RepID=UPI00253F8597|nr:uncharacterized protein N7459_002751 [Penicillium hispanicum]KAJ5586986.1 hypothetical protein N7459_002751 [Penicillium hispanicum]
MGGSLNKIIFSVAAFAYGLFSVIVHGMVAIKRGLFFTKRTEKEDLELQLARDRFWNLSRTFSGLSHHFLTLPSGFKFHFVSNEIPSSPAVLSSNKPLVIFIHGFPDSWAEWRHIIALPDLQNVATLVAIDLPGYGGTQSLERYSATNILEKLTEFIVTLRTQYGVDDSSESNKKRTIVVSHDWGCMLSMRLASEAPSLAHRFILSNAPLPSLAKSNIRRYISSAQKMFNTALGSPLHARAPLLQSLRTLSPLFRQLVSSGYVFAIQMPTLVARYYLTGGNHSLMKAIHKIAHGRSEYTTVDAAESMASSMGPSLAESKTKTANGETYPTTIKYDSEFANIMGPASYYRQGGGVGRWHKSLETITALHGLAGGNELRRTSSGQGLFDEGAPGVLRASSTVLWGEKDSALNLNVCLDGIADYLVHGSQVVMLPETGHWTPVEVESRAAITKAVQWSIEGEQGDVGAAIQAVYPSAKVTAHR